MPGLTHYISDEELSIDRERGILSGDDNPASTQAGVLTKLARMSDELEADFDGLKTVFDAHDHTSGGQPLGTGGVRSFAVGAITTAKILDGNVTTAKVASSAITTAKILDDNVTEAKIGDAAHADFSLATGASTSWSPPRNYPHFHLEGTDSGDITVSGYGTASISLVNNGLNTCNFSIVYR